MKKPFEIAVMAAAGDAPATIRLSGFIGSSFWDDSSVSEKQFLDALDSIPKGQKIEILVNSEGGSIKDGLGMYAAIKARASDITARITGYALSIASVIPLAAGRVISPKGSVWMLHKPWTYASGNSDEFSKVIKMLDKHEESLVSIYQEATGKSADEIKAALTDETWLTGEEAVSWGLADEVSDEPVTLASLDQSRYRRMPVALGATTPPPATNQPKKGTNVLTKTDAAQAGATTSATQDTDNHDTQAGAKLMAELHAVKDQLAALKRKQIEASVDKAISDRRITQGEREGWITDCLKNEGFLARLEALPLPQAAATPIRSGSVEVVGDAIDTLFTHKDAKARFKFAVENLGDIRRAESKGNVRERVQAANTSSGIATITGTMVSDGVTTVLQSKLAPLMALARDFSANPMVPRQPVVFRQVTAGGTAQSNPTNFEDTTNFVGTVEPITLTPAQLVSGSHLTNAELNSGLRMQDWVEIKGAEIGNKIMAAVAAIITTSNFTATPLVAAAASFGGSDMKTLWGQLKKANRKVAVLDGEYYAALLPATRENYNVQEGGWPGWDGVYLNTTWTGATTNTVGFVCDPTNAIAAVAGLPAIASNAGAAGLSQESFTVPGIGISILTTNWFSLSGRVTWQTLELVFGAAKNDGTAGVLVKSA